MDTRIGKVRIRYRVPAGHSPASTLTSLQNIAQQKIAVTCDQALASVFEDDPTVYVIRRVNSRVAVLAQRRTSDARLAEQWGSNLCKSVVRSIVRNDSDDNLVRFENQSEFVSCFLTRIALGDAWDHWYFGAFTTFRGLPPDEVVIAVLSDNHQLVPQILSRLKRSNALEYVLNLLGASGQRQVWEKLIRSAPIDDQTIEAFHIFAQAAFEIADALSIWRGGRPDESDVLHSYLYTKPISPDWTSGTSLAEAVSSLLRFMANERLLDVSSTPSEERWTKLREVLASTFDWLDFNHLLNSVSSILNSSQFTSANREFTLRPRQTTPAQNRVLEELLVRLQSKNLRLTLVSPNVHETLLRMVTSLSDVSDAAVTSSMTGLLESIVLSANAILNSDNPIAVLTELQQGRIPTITSNDDVGNHLKAVVEAGSLSRSLVVELVQTMDSVQDEGLLIESECAGLFLLVRVLQDLRMTSILKECGCESIRPLLTGIAVSIFKERALHDESLDAGVAAWSGSDVADYRRTFEELEAIDWQQLATAVSEIAIAQRLIDSSEVVESIGSSGTEPYSRETAESLNHISALLLKAWARWLPGLSNSSTNYLLDNFIRRSGTIIVNVQRITVQLERRPLDEILKLAGYLADTPPVPWLDGRPVRYRFPK